MNVYEKLAANLMYKELPENAADLMLSYAYQTVNSSRDMSPRQTAVIESWYNKIPQNSIQTVPDYMEYFQSLPPPISETKSKQIAETYKQLLKDNYQQLGLNSSDSRHLLSIMDHKFVEGKLFATTQTLADDRGVSVATITKVFKKLKLLGYYELISKPYSANQVYDTIRDLSGLFTALDAFRHFKLVPAPEVLDLTELAPFGLVDITDDEFQN